VFLQIKWNGFPHVVVLLCVYCPHLPPDGPSGMDYNFLLKQYVLTRMDVLEPLKTPCMNKLCTIGVKHAIELLGVGILPGKVQNIHEGKITKHPGTRMHREAKVAVNVSSIRITPQCVRVRVGLSLVVAVVIMLVCSERLRSVGLVCGH